jgi:hypothetical protein
MEIIQKKQLVAKPVLESYAEKARCIRFASDAGYESNELVTGIADSVRMNADQGRLAASASMI